MFNSRYNKKKDPLAGRRMSSLTGPSFGLKVVLELEEQKYMQGGFSTQV